MASLHKVSIYEKQQSQNSWKIDTRSVFCLNLHVLCISVIMPGMMETKTIFPEEYWQKHRYCLWKKSLSCWVAKIVIWNWFHINETFSNFCKSCFASFSFLSSRKGQNSLCTDRPPLRKHRPSYTGLATASHRRPFSDFSWGKRGLYADYWITRSKNF